MLTDTQPPEVSEVVVKGRIAACCARRRLEVDHLSDMDLEDMMQVATLAYWRRRQEGRSIPFSFVCARQAAERCYYRQIVGRNPFSALSLDAAVTDGSDLPHEWLAVPAPSDDGIPRLAWLSDEELDHLLFDARLAAGFARGKPTRHRSVIQTDRQIIRLAANGHTNASIAEIMGTTEGTIRNRRQRIRRLLEGLLPADAPPVEYSRTGGNQHKAREIQLTYPAGQKSPRA